MSSPLINMRIVAEKVALSYDRFRKVWPQLHAELSFPPPVRERCWDEAAVEAWIAKRSRRSLVPAAPERTAHRSDADRARRAREQLAALRDR